MWELYRPGTPWGALGGTDKIAFDVIEGRSQTAARIALMQYYLLVPFAIAGAVIMWRRRVTIVPLVSLVIVACVTAVYTFGNTRYRSIAEVAIVAFAAVAIEVVLGRLLVGWRSRRSQPVLEGTRAPGQPDAEGAGAKAT